MRSKISLAENLSQKGSKKEIGPVSMNFEIPQYNVSKLNIKYLKIETLNSEKITPCK